MSNNKIGDMGLETPMMPSIEFLEVFKATMDYTEQHRFQFMLPEVLLLKMVEDAAMGAAMRRSGVDVGKMKAEIESYLDKVEKVPGKRQVKSKPSVGFQAVLHDIMSFLERDPEPLNPVHLLDALYEVDGTEAHRILHKYMSVAKWDMVAEETSKVYDESYQEQEQMFGKYPLGDMSGNKGRSGREFEGEGVEEGEGEFEEDRACVRIDEDKAYDGSHFCGREDDVRKAVMTLLKGRRGNIVFVGDRGVGKSAMVEGLIKSCKGEYAKGSRYGKARFYKLNPSAIVTGVSYTDEIENHVQDIVDDISAGGKGEKGSGGMAVLFVDNMAELMPQNQNDNTPDTLRLLTSLVEGEDIHIVTTATFEQYKRLSQHNQYIEKTFTRIDLAEPKIDPDCREMVKAVHSDIAKSHGLSYSSTVADYVVDMAVGSYSKDCAMPGRAIDLFDSVCAYVEMRASKRSKAGDKMVTNVSVDEYLKAMGYDNISSREGKEERLRELEPNMLKKIFGQDEAVHGVSQSVLLAKAGLSDDSKPLASYLFVGPTGVGKTELAKVLAQELGTKLIRFDMSEYSEQHTVSKLVGSPAGYVGYDDGGLLTDAVRKNPNCVLLFDEIEKAHSAVFNLLLQVLDYAKLTDNKGQKADFSGTIIIMTSNAGARFANGNGLGYGAKSEKSEVMSGELKRVFSPEFLNRLTQIVAFHDMSRAMAEKILDRKVEELRSMLGKRRSVTFELTGEAREMLLKEGFSSHYGAREMDRAIGKLLKPALMEALLFGGVKEGARLKVEKDGDKMKAQ